jgi:hypothetical protein
MGTVNLPDFDLLFEIADEIYKLSVKQAKLESKIKFEESMIVKEVVSNPKYWKDGKSPAMNYIEAVYKYIGLDKNLMIMREELIETRTLLDQKQIVLNLYKLQVEVWKSQNYNNKGLTL